MEAEEEKEEEEKEEEEEEEEEEQEEQQQQQQHGGRLWPIRSKSLRDKKIKPNKFQRGLTTTEP